MPVPYLSRAVVHFAYNEASFMLVRLLPGQQVAPESMVSPYVYSPGSDGTNVVWMATHLATCARGKYVLGSQLTAFDGI
ncbi:hypothetical protein GSI_01793 [Ganoderma sinense ZZ0214-1]|uniref:Uncharacterized protein n=1 Tax=Ganoderma sinense ZZ0214-1 TaxID=1077348 RepID=A0A2G8SQZ0_9APHY|nr:hypothetical protein GSI_01793 [Ganoderma sinense ZZ0214-1]